MASVTTTGEAAGPLVEPRPAGLTRSGAIRLDAIDLPRGLVIAILIPLAHWFAGVKRRRRDWSLSYL